MVHGRPALLSLPVCLLHPCRLRYPADASVQACVGDAVALPLRLAREADTH